jgi:ATP-dependent Lhr-like helicase
MKGRRQPRWGRGRPARTGLHTLYISPLKALAVDIARNLSRRRSAEMGCRSGRDPHRRHAAGQAAAPALERYPPDILLTTPEQLALLLSHPRCGRSSATLKRVVLDELHALVTSKRGDLLSLGLARLRRLAPGIAYHRPVGDRRRPERAAALWLAAAGAGTPSSSPIS